MGYVDHARDMKGTWENDEYKLIFDKAVIAVNKFWDDKLSDYLYDERPDMVKLINASDERLERLWGKASVAEFRQELIRFYKLHQKVYNDYNA